MGRLELPGRPASSLQAAGLSAVHSDLPCGAVRSGRSARGWSGAYSARQDWTSGPSTCAARRPLNRSGGS